MAVDEANSMRSAITQDGILRTPPNAATVPEYTSSLISVPLPPLDLSKGIDHPDNCKIPENVRREFNEKLRQWKEPSNDAIHHLGEGDEYPGMVSVPWPRDPSKSFDHPDNCKVPEHVRKELEMKLNEFRGENAQAALVNDFSKVTIDVDEDDPDMVWIPLPPHDLENGMLMTVVPPESAAEFNSKINEGPVEDA